MARRIKIKVTLPTPHEAQQEIMNNATLRNVVAMGEKGGKTTMGVEILLASKFGALVNSAPVAWFSATKKDMLEVRRDITHRADTLIRRRANSRRIELLNNNVIDFYSLEDTVEVFEQYGLIVVDDVAMIDGFLDFWEDVLQHTLREHEGQAWFLSNAYGKKNHFYRLFKKSDEEPDWISWQVPSFANPHVPADVVEEADNLSDEEYAQRFSAEFLEHAIELTAASRIIGHDETFLDWCERLENEGLKVDGHPFTLSNRPAMRFIYELIPSTPEEAFGRIDVIMKCTQVGFTVMEMLAMIYLAIKFGPAKMGMFMPSQMLAAGKSSQRFMPIVRTVPNVYAMMTDRQASGTRGGEGNVLIRNLGNSRFHFLWTSGKTATESNPMDVLSFDEVQEMAIADMEKTQERLSASRIRYTLMGSTANWPDADIHWWYKRGTQHRFFTECPTCETLQILADHFPQCIAYDPTYPRRSSFSAEDGDIPMGEYRYRCCECEGWIDDPQVGQWIAKVPDATIRSVHFPQFLSPTISARDIIEAFNNADDMKNFYNRKLGMPYTDPSQVPVNLEILDNCAKAGMEAGLEWKRSAVGTFMGIDQMGHFNVAILKERMGDGRQAVIHLEYIFNDDPFARCSELMGQYGVQCCVVETLPNYNDAKRFAHAHPGKVFLAGYGNMDGNMLLWGDQPHLGVSDRRSNEEARDQYTVRLDQYKCMQVSMARFQNTLCLFPDPSELVQEYLEKGQSKLLPVCKDVAFLHFTRTALVAEKDEDEKKYKRRVVKVGIDPHTSYANMLCDVAWARAHGTSTFILPEGPDPSERNSYNTKVKVPGLAGRALEEINTLEEDTCGTCENCDRDNRYCRELEAGVRLDDPGCWAYIAIEGDT